MYFVLSSGTGTKAAGNETEHIRKRLFPRDLFSGSSPEKARKLISNDVTKNLRQLDGPAIHNTTSDSRTEGNVSLSQALKVELMAFSGG